MKIRIHWRGNGETEEESRGSYFLGHENQLFQEQFKALRAKFEYRIGMLNCKVVAVTSAIAGEGKTMSTVNLARNIASSGRKKVLLVDMDLRKSDMAKKMDISPHPGLSEYLAGSAVPGDIMRQASVPGLYVIPGGMRMSSPGDLIAGQKFRSFLEELRGNFDVILLDTPPLIPVSDALTLKAAVDSYIFVYRTGFTPHQLFRQAVEEIGEKNILGVILNGVEPKTPRYYQRYYGKYYTKNGKGSSPA